APDEPQLVPLSLPEIRRLIARLADLRPAPITHALNWSHWRRRAQYRARVSHYKRRGHSP
ncbi:IS701 family transposase, partial [Embleya sp. NPDC020630]